MKPKAAASRLGTRAYSFAFYHNQPKLRPQASAGSGR